MVDMQHYWPVVVAIGAGTFLLRSSFLVLLGRAEVPGRLVRVLRFIPAAVLPALIVPIVLSGGGEAGGGAIGFSRPVAALVAALVAWKTKNVLATIGVGLVTLWILDWIISVSL